MLQNQPSVNSIRFYDSHAHLDMITENTEQVLARAKASQVEAVLQISSDPKDLKKILQLAQTYKLPFAWGIHPHHAHEITAEVWEEIESKAHLAQAIGETGLDYFYLKSNQEIQKEWFIRQIKLALNLNKPLVIHARDAEWDVIEILHNEAAIFKKAHPHLSAESTLYRGVTHCFTGNVAQAQAIVKLGFKIGITGIVTFKKAINVQEVVEAIDVNDLLIETDAPYLAPVPHRGASNEPAFVPFVAQKIAEIKKLSLEEVAFKTFASAEKLFGLPT